jgi:N-[(2S)-2-amino-2-carboxyethyl]-L-glutamate dehydrogenase
VNSSFVHDQTSFEGSALMTDGDILVLSGQEVQSLLDGREQELLQTVKATYVAHTQGESSLPHSTFLNFPNEPRNRIIALPAYLGAGFGMAGVKWISSFPNNLNRGLDRASAVLILNSLETGRPKAILEGTVISAKRTAASAALAAQFLAVEGNSAHVTMIGCGPINFEIVRFLRVARPEMKHLYLFDLSHARAAYFKETCERTFEGVTVEVVADLNEALSRGEIISLATTAVKPHISTLSACAQGSTILHISLRDMAPEIILAHDNIVDDIDHVCRAQTSIHLAEQLAGNRDFIRCTLADVMMGATLPRRDREGLTIFSPFGLGVLDLAVGNLAYDLGVKQKRGTVIESFFPEPWSKGST